MTRISASIQFFALLCLASSGATVVRAAPSTAEPAPDAVLENWIHTGCKHGDATEQLLRRAPAPLDRATRPIDVEHVDLEIAFRDTTSFIDARMQARVRLEEAARVVDFDLWSESTQSLGLRVLGAKVDGIDAAFTHASDTLRVELGTERPANAVVEIDVTYEGKPIDEGFPGYGLRQTNLLDADFRADPTRPVLQTLSQPTGARRWWPCHDHPADAATVDLTVTIPPGFELAAPGIRQGPAEELGDGRTRLTYSMPHPIPSYLVSLIAADFERWTETVDVLELQGDGGAVPRSMEIVYYAPSNRVDDAEFTWQNTATMMEVFEDLWGPYPYADVKYGNAVFNGAVAMEHPTLSSIGDSPFTLSSLTSTLYPGPVGDLINAHELAHQWFGDAVRVARWGDIWLNEGFARFAEIVWLEEFYGPEYGQAYRERLRESRDRWDGTLRDPDGLFGLVSYNRGALTLHMLAKVMGRTELFTAMRNYVTDPALRFQAVTIEDFQAHCEDVYGAPLDWFFGPWMTRDALPRLDVTWSNADGSLDFEVRQTNGAEVELPLSVRLELVDGTTLDRIVWIGRGPIEPFSVPGPVLAVTVDPDDDWLVEIDSVVSPAGARFDGAWPNPFNAGTEIHYEVIGATDLRVDIFDVRGRRVWSRALEDVAPGPGSLAWDGRDADGRAIASGVYYVRFDAAGRAVTKKLALVR